MASSFERLESIAFTFQEKGEAAEATSPKHTHTHSKEDKPPAG
jgi:hypothetical protein